MEDKNCQTTNIDYKRVLQEVFKRKRLFYKTLPIAFFLSCAYIVSLPRYYTTETTLAPETENPMKGGTIGSLASTFGLDLNGFESSDAITPLLYPDLMEDNGFVTNMFGIQVKTKDGSIETTYHDYLSKHLKYPWWTSITGFFSNLFASGTKEEGVFDPYNLPKAEDDIAKAISSNVRFKADKKTGVITITVEDQDPLICKTIADSVKYRLQTFITNYRTNKARTDYEYYLELAAEAKEEYDKSRQLYAKTADANTNVALKSVEMKLEELENSMQLKFNTYSTINTQLQAAKAKVQERTPAFTTIKGAAVPIKPAGPKRMIFVFTILVLTFIGTFAYILHDILRSQPSDTKS